MRKVTRPKGCFAHFLQAPLGMSDFLEGEELLGVLVDGPVIAGGLITDKEDVTGALSAGAVAVSATNPAVWEM